MKTIVFTLIHAFSNKFKQVTNSFSYKHTLYGSIATITLICMQSCAGFGRYDTCKYDDYLRTKAYLIVSRDHYTLLIKDLMLGLLVACLTEIKKKISNRRRIRRQWDIYDDFINLQTPYFWFWCKYVFTCINYIGV